jgi:hypothetical protein
MILSSLVVIVFTTVGNYQFLLWNTGCGGKRTGGPFDIPKSSYILVAIDRVVYRFVILDMMGVESYRAKKANQQHLSQHEEKQLLSKEVLLESSSAKIIVATSTI